MPNETGYPRSIAARSVAIATLLSGSARDHGTRTISNQLMLGADWALAHGDFDTVAHILATNTNTVHRAELLEMADLFHVDIERASQRRPDLRARATHERH